MYFSSSLFLYVFFILKTHVQHYELKSQMFIIIISTRESDQISFFSPHSLIHSLTRVSSIPFAFYLPFSHILFVPFTSNWWCDIYKMILIFDLIGWLFELLQMDIKSNKFVYCFCFFFSLIWRFDQKIKYPRFSSHEKNRKRAIFIPLSNFTPIYRTHTWHVNTNKIKTKTDLKASLICRLSQSYYW